MERLLIATTDPGQGERLVRYLAASSVRFDLQLTSDRQTLRSAISDDSISAVVADADMMASLGYDSIRSENPRQKSKPVLVSPRLSWLDSEQSPQPTSRHESEPDELQLFKNQLNNEIDVWRRLRSDRRLSRGNTRFVGPSNGRDPITGFSQPVAVENHGKCGNPSRDRRQIVSCVTLKWELGRGDSRGDTLAAEKGLRAAADHLRQKMRRCDLGIRWDPNTLAILRPSSPLGECWLWAEELRRELDAISARNPGSAVAGMSVLEVPTAGFSRATLQSGEAAAARSARYEGGCMQTPMMGLLATGHRWARLRKLPPRQRRIRLLDLLRLSLGHAQIEHVGPHCQWVSKLAGEIAIACGLDERGIEYARLAALFHDIGKILVPNDILAKPGQLSPPEKLLMQKHISWGADVCNLLDLGNPICQAVRDHHARFDESGCGVPLLARIIAVADAMATMASRRDYCRARPMDAALAELRRERGGQFDPLVVDAVCSASIRVTPDRQSASNN